MPTAITDSNIYFAVQEWIDDPNSTESANFGNITEWDVSGVTQMYQLFKNGRGFVAKDEGWWTQNTTVVGTLDTSGSQFNADISGWDTSSVTNMQSMFDGCTSFNKNINTTTTPTRWDTSNVEDMAFMFNGATSFNRNIGDWDVSKVENMGSMFREATVFNNGDNVSIKNWKTGKVKYMDQMFRKAREFNQNLPTNGDQWDVSKVENMVLMFQVAEEFNGSLSDWDTSSLIGSLWEMFGYAYKFNQSVSHFDISNVTNLQGTFLHAYDFDNGVDATLGWSTGNVNTMAHTFREAEKFNQNIGDWDTSKVEYMEGMFWNAKAFNQNLITNVDKWNVSKVKNMVRMFRHAEEFNGYLSGWDTSSLIGSLSEMFGYAYKFNRSVSHFDISKVTSLHGTFYSASVFNNGDDTTLEWSTGNVTKMTNMFASAVKFNKDISSWDTSQVTYMNHMFNVASEFNQDLRGWNTTSVDSTTINVDNDLPVGYNHMFNLTKLRTASPPSPYYTYTADGEGDWVAHSTPKQSYFNQSSGNICFLGSTKVQTDQGKIRFDELTTDNTIDGQKIKQVVKVINSDDNLIFIRKHAFAKKVPSQNTYISRNHGVYLDDSFIQEKDLEPQVHELIYHIAGKNLVRARNLIKMGAVTEVKRGKKDALYNILLETHSTMIVNNIPCETLNPNDPMSQKYIK